MVFEHEDRSLEVYMMLDTGATYTTLPTSVLARLGALPSADDPVLTCLVDVVQGITFPEPSGSGVMVVSYPFVFSPAP